MVPLDCRVAPFGSPRNDNAKTSALPGRSVGLNRLSLRTSSSGNLEEFLNLSIKEAIQYAVENLIGRRLFGGHRKVCGPWI